MADYCEKCGTKLEWVAQPAGYDPNTGKARYTMMAKCKNSTPFFNKHTVLNPHYIDRPFGSPVLIFSLEKEQIAAWIKNVEHD